MKKMWLKMLVHLFDIAGMFLMVNGVILAITNYRGKRG